MKVFADLITVASKNKEINNIRYALSLRQLDPEGTGRVEVGVAITTLSTKFKVMPKTVLNNLYLCENKGFGNFDLAGHYFYYYEQVRLIEALGGQLTRRSAVIVEDFDGSVVEVRAKLHAALLATNGCEVMMTRDTISEISGRAKRTQRKYEKLSGIKVQSNFARFIEYNGNKHDLDRVRFSGHADFILHDPKTNKHYIAKQLCNSYSFAIKSSRKKTRHPLMNKGRGKSQKVYFDNLDSADKAWKKQDGRFDVYFWNNQDKIFDWQTPVDRW